MSEVNSWDETIKKHTITRIGDLRKEYELAVQEDHLTSVDQALMEYLDVISKRLGEATHLREALLDTFDEFYHYHEDQQILLELSYVHGLIEGYLQCLIKCFVTPSIKPEP